MGDGWGVEMCGQLRRPGCRLQVPESRASPERFPFLLDVGDRDFAARQRHMPRRSGHR